MAKTGEGGGQLVCLFFILRETYLPNLSFLQSLESLEKVPGDGGCLNPILVFSLSLSQAEQLG